MLDWLDRQRGIAPHIPVFDKSGRKDGTFERADFTYDAESGLYTCPGGKELKQSRRPFTPLVRRSPMRTACSATGPARPIAMPAS
ncbi:hypothetical protein A6024_10170 [Rhodovulum sulfidophilum]|nr:hypothetical protein A6024_10170 [Rhodovulum sulfidophilum]